MYLLKILVVITLIGCIVYYIYNKHSRTVVSLHQNGYFTTSSSGITKNISVSFEFQTLIPGYLFSYGISDTIGPKSVIHITINMYGNVSARRVTLQEEDGIVDQKNVVIDGKWHTLQFTIKGTKWSLLIDDTLTVATFRTKNDIKGDSAYFGGNGEIKDSFLFMGCFRNVIFGNESKTNFEFVPSGRSIHLGMTDNSQIVCKD